MCANSAASLLRGRLLRRCGRAASRSSRRWRRCARCCSAGWLAPSWRPARSPAVRRSRGRCAELAVAPWLRDRFAAGQDVAGEGRLQRLLQRLVLGDVDRGDREQDHEQRHQQRDHVGVGQQPALVALLLGASVAAAAAVPAGHDQAALASTSRRADVVLVVVGALGGRQVGHQLFGDQARVVAGLDREDPLDASSCAARSLRRRSP